MNIYKKYSTVPLEVHTVQGASCLGGGLHSQTASFL